MYILKYEEQDNLANDARLLMGECQLYVEAMDILSDKLYGESTVATLLSYVKKIWSWVVKVWKMVAPLIDKLFGTSFSSNNTNYGGAYGAGPTNSTELVANPRYCKNSHGTVTNINNTITVSINMLAGTQDNVKPIGSVANTIKTSIMNGNQTPNDIIAAISSSLKDVLDKVKLNIDNDVINQCFNSFEKPLMNPNDSLTPKLSTHGYDINTAYNDYTKFFMEMVLGMMDMQLSPDRFIENQISRMQELLNRGHRSLVLLQSAIPFLRDPRNVNDMFGKITMKDHVKVPIFKNSATLSESITHFLGYKNLIEEYGAKLKSGTATKVELDKLKERVLDHIRTKFAGNNMITLEDLVNNESDEYKYLDFVISKIFTDNYEIRDEDLRSVTLTQVMYSGTGVSPQNRGKAPAVQLNNIKPKSVFESMYSHLWSKYGVSDRTQKAFKKELSEDMPSHTITPEDMANYKDLSIMTNLYLCLFTIFAKVHKNIFKCACIEYLSNFYVLNMELATDVMKKANRI